MEEIIKIYLRDKSSINPFTGENLSKSKRIESMYVIIQNRVYGKTYTNKEKILASKLITQILEEID